MRTVRFVLPVLLAAACAGRTATPAAPVPAPPAEPRLLMVHGDDMGIWHGVNAAIIRGLETGVISSASVMVPCPWFPEAAAYARAHPHVDLGIHLTLTSERPLYRWGPVAPRQEVPSLVDGDGFFHKAADVSRIDPREAEIEIRAQIRRARAFGIVPTHVDGHQNVLYATRELFAVMRAVAREENLPIRLFRERLALYRKLGLDLGEDEIWLDRAITINPSVPAQGWSTFYTDALERHTSGVAELVIHPGLANDELRAATADRATWGAEWRQRDLDYVLSPVFKQTIARRGIRLVGWRDLAADARAQR